MPLIDEENEPPANDKGTPDRDATNFNKVDTKITYNAIGKVGYEETS